MASKYWIKLYHEMLHDRKVASLDDRLWRRVIEMFLLAGEQNENGYLPPLVDIAWTLRADIEQLETELNELTRIGILEFKNEKYFVRKFEKRQEPMDKAEYMRRLRDQEQKKEHYETLPPRYQSVTAGNIESDTDTDIEVDIDKEAEEKPNADGIYADLSVAFCNKTGIPELTGGPSRWYDSLKRMGEAGVTAQDIENAVDLLRDKDYSIVSLRSVENTAIGEMSRRVGKQKKVDPQKYVSGKYAEHINH